MIAAKTPRRQPALRRRVPLSLRLDLEVIQVRADVGVCPDGESQRQVCGFDSTRMERLDEPHSRTIAATPRPGTGRIADVILAPEVRPLAIEIREGIHGHHRVGPGGEIDDLEGVAEGIPE